MKRNIFKNKLSISLCFALLGSLSLQAQETTQLGEVTVREKAVSKYQGSSKVSINRNKLSKEDSAKAIQTFNEKLIQEAKAQNISDIISLASNTFYIGSVDGKTTSISMRGFSGVPLLYDGQKVSNQIANPEIFAMEGVEVSKGGDALYYGSTSAGGMVNLLKKKATKENKAYLELEVNDNPAFSPKLDIGGALSKDKKLYYRLVSVFKNDKGFANFNKDARRIFLAPSLAYDISDNNTLSFIAEYTKEKTPSDFGGMVDNNGKLITSYKKTMSHPDEQFEKAQKIIGLDFDGTYDDWNQNFKYRFITHKRDYGDVYLPLFFVEESNSIVRFPSKQRQEFKEHSFQYTLNKEFKAFNLENNFSLGADFNRVYSRTIAGNIRAPHLINLSNIVYEEALITPPNITYPDLLYTDSYGVFIQNNINLTDNLVFNAGLRYTKTKAQQDPKTPLIKAENSKATTPSFGLIYHLNPQTRLFANYSETFNPNDIFRKDKNGALLKAEEAKAYEFGIKHKMNNLDLSASLFRIQKENVASVDPDSLSLPRQYYEASGKQESQGLEFDLALALNEDWSLMASYGYIKTKDKSKNNKELKNTPRHNVNLFTTYSLSALNLPDFYIGAKVKYLGDKFADEENKKKISSATLFDATIGYQKGKFNANISVQNIANKEYVLGNFHNGLNLVHTSAPRAIIASIGYKF